VPVLGLAALVLGGLALAGLGLRRPSR